MLIDIFKVFFIRGFGAAAGFLVTLVIARVFSVDDAGYILLSLALTSFIGTLITLGSPTLLVKLVGAESVGCWSNINKGFGTLIGYTLLCGISLLISFVVFNSYIANLFEKPELATLLPFIGVAVIFFSLVQLIASALQGKQVIVFASLVQSVITPLSFLSAIFFGYLLSVSFNAKHGLAIYTACLVLTAIIGLTLWFKDKRTKFLLALRLEPSLKTALIPLTLVMVMTQCVQWAGQLATGRYLSTESIAYFASAQRTALLASFVLMVVNLVVSPKFAKAFAKGNFDEVNKLSLLSSRLMIALAVPVLTFMFFFPEFLMGLFGEEYKVAAPLLQILAVGQFINVITGSVGYLLSMTGHEKDLRNIQLICGPVAILLAIVLTKNFGLMGAALATSISISTQNLLAVFLVKRRLGFNSINIFRSVR